jgi:tetratricopeptide (TPR) repeat protein/predicted Ser/Thr protein kinase
MASDSRNPLLDEPSRRPAPDAPAAHPPSRAERKGDTTEAVKIDLPEDVAAARKDPSRVFAGGRYILVREAGHGGMGQVWKAWQTDLKRYVAVKVLVGTAWTETELKRFNREAQLAASLSHANIASIYELGTHEGKHFMVMEFVEGDSLAKLMTPATNRQGTQRSVKHLPPRKAIEILREAALAVDFAHSKKIIHRDLKPHNIMVQKIDGRVFVMDFGLAKPIKKEDSITLSDAIVGTPQYMSPEQARGEAVDPRTDVFSLGAVLYHALTGKPPFDGNSPGEIMMSVLADDPAPPRKLNPRLHADVETICLKAIDKDRDRRYETAKALADDLGRWLEGEAISARPLSRIERLWKEIRRRPLQAGAGGAAVAGLLLVGSMIGFQGLMTRWKIQGFERQAREAYHAGRHAEAKGFCEKIFAFDPMDPEALQLWELANEKSQDPERQLQKERRLKEQVIRRNHREAEINVQAGRFQEALGLTLQILAFDPNDPEAIRRRTHCEEALAKDARERDLLEKKLDETETAVRVQREEIERQRLARISAFGDYHRARQAVEDGARMRLQDESGSGFTIAEVKTKYQEAYDALTRALAKDRTYAEALHFRGQVQIRLGEFALAEKDFKEAGQYSSDAGPAAFGAAMSQLVLYVLHSYGVDEVRDRAAREAALKGLAAWAEKADRVQNTFERFSLKALQDFRNRNLAAALDKLETIRPLGRADYFFHFMLACCHMEGGDWRKANLDLTLALELEPTAIESRLMRSVVRLQTEDLAGARVDAEKAVEAVPQTPSVAYLPFLLRARVFQEAREVPRALSDLRRAGSLAGPLSGSINSLHQKWLQSSRPEK